LTLFAKVTALNSVLRQFVGSRFIIQLRWKSAARAILMLIRRHLVSTFLCVVWVVLSVAIGIAAECQQENFATWLEHFKQQAIGLGISQGTITSALNGITYDPAVIARDHAQSVFQQSLEQFSGRMVSPDRLRKGANMLKRYGSILARIEGRYGVPGEVLVAIWGLESDYGVNQGKYSTLRSLATLAYDCRRAEKFRAELLDALRIIERGDLTAGEMIGAWAGEIGQTQFLPSAYLKFAVDFEGYGHRDLIHSALNALASTANYLKNYGWVSGKPWTEGAANFVILQKWNESEVYTKTVAYFATRLEKEP
jgi:lytic murein transglycosylase